MDIVAERCPQGRPVVSAAVLVGQFINTWPRKPCCFSSHTHRQDKEKMPRVDLYPKSIWSEKSVISNHLRRPLLECPGLAVSLLSIPSAKGSEGYTSYLTWSLGGRRKMRLWKLVLVGNPEATSLDLHWPACHWPRKKEKEEDYDMQMFPKSTLIVLLISLESGLVGHSPTSPVPSGHFGSSSSCLKLKSKPCSQIPVFLARPKKISKMLGENFQQELGYWENEMRSWQQEMSQGFARENPRLSGKTDQLSGLLTPG